VPTADYTENQAILDIVVVDKEGIVKEQSAKAQAGVMAPVINAVASMGYNVSQLTPSFSLRW
jgi:hypothetical protein